MILDSELLKLHAIWYYNERLHHRTPWWCCLFIEPYCVQDAKKPMSGEVANGEFFYPIPSSYPTSFNNIPKWRHFFTKSTQFCIDNFVLINIFFQNYGEKTIPTKFVCINYRYLKTKNAQIKSLKIVDMENIFTSTISFIKESTTE